MCKKWTLLLPPRPQCPGLARLAACPWLGDDYFLATISRPSANQRLLSAQPDQSEDSTASLNITFLPPSVLLLMGHHQDYYYAGAWTGKLNLENNIVKCLFTLLQILTLTDWILGQAASHDCLWWCLAWCLDKQPISMIIWWSLSYLFNLDL